MSGPMPGPQGRTSTRLWKWLHGQWKTQINGVASGIARPLDRHRRRVISGRLHAIDQNATDRRPERFPLAGMADNDGCVAHALVLRRVPVSQTAVLRRHLQRDRRRNARQIRVGHTVQLRNPPPLGGISQLHCGHMIKRPVRRRYRHSAHDRVPAAICVFVAALVTEASPSTDVDAMLAFWASVVSEPAPSKVIADRFAPA